MNILTSILKKSLFERRVFRDILKWISKKEAIILLGSRQVGKTSLLYLLVQYLVRKTKILGDDIFYFDLERLEDFELLNSGVEDLLRFIGEQSPASTKKYVFIDEIQYLDNPSNLLKILVDHHSDRIKVFATGSSALTIKKKFKDSLVGRKITFEITSLDFWEYLLFNGEKKMIRLIDKYYQIDEFGPISELSHGKLLRHYYEYSLFGGFPAVVLLENADEKKKYLSDMYTSYVRKDINALFSLENLTAFNKIVKLLALNVGNLINIHEVSKEVGIARQTVEKYFSILESTYICRFIQPFFTNKKKEIVKMAKVYFYDTGLRNRVINDFRQITDRVDAGALIENTVFKNLLKRVESTENIKFWRMKYGVEVDFILDEEELLPIEVKTKKMSKIPTGMASFLNEYANKTKIAIISNEKTIEERNNVKFLPFYLI